jgi:hypothetical protein
VPIDKTIDLAAMTGRQKGNDGPEKGRAPVSIAGEARPQSRGPSASRRPL